MITAITGKNGSGKTFIMIREAFYRWKKGEDIYSNTPLLFESYRKKKWKTGRIFYYEDINDIIHIRSGVVLFDEAQALLNSRNWENLPDEFQFKLQQHRKHQLDLICTTPNMGSIDIVYRRLVHRWLHCENLFSLGKSPRLIIQLTRVNEKDIDQLEGSDKAKEVLKEKLKFGAEGTVIGGAIPLLAPAGSLGIKYGLVAAKPITYVGGQALRAVDYAVVNPLSKLIAGTDSTSLIPKIITKGGELIDTAITKTGLPKMEDWKFSSREGSLPVICF